MSYPQLKPGHEFNVTEHVIIVEFAGRKHNLRLLLLLKRVQTKAEYSETWQNVNGFSRVAL